MAHLAKRNSVYYIKFTRNGSKRKLSTNTTNYQQAREQLRQFQEAEAKGEGSGLPTRTPIARVVGAYVDYIRTVKREKSAQTDTYYLRDAFGPICPQLEITSRRVMSASVKKRPPKPGQDRRRTASVIEARYFEHVTTAQIAAFISGQVASRGLAPKTANRYREILTRLFNWAMTQHGINIPGDRNPAARVERHKERAPIIRFLNLKQIDQQLEIFNDRLQMQTMVATLIYAGLRREELLWLTHGDLDLAAGANGMIRVRAKVIGEEKWEPKTDGSNRAVPVSSALRHFLNKWTLKHQKGTWLFPSPGGVRWDPDNFSQDLRAANGPAKLEWGCLDFRHTFGSMLAQRGVSLYHISALMGNSPEICRRHYAALVPEALADSVEFVTPSPTPIRQETATATA